MRVARLRHRTSLIVVRAIPVRRAPNDQIIASGVALGHADYAAKENSLVVERAPPEAFVIRQG